MIQPVSIFPAYRKKYARTLGFSDIVDLNPKQTHGLRSGDSAAIEQKLDFSGGYVDILIKCLEHGYGRVWAGILAFQVVFSPAVLVAGEHETMMSKEPWFQGTVEEAFTKAANEQKPVFLYWGAVWCPPCNQLKATIFADDQFKSLMTGAVAVYLDGDTDRAQLWSDKLKVTGYPTILVLRPGKTTGESPQELARLDYGLSIEEFAGTIAETLTGGMALSNALSEIQKGQGGLRPWNVVNGIAWSQLDENTYPPDKRISILSGLVQKAPNPTVRAQLAASLLGEVLSARSGAGTNLEKSVASVKIEAETYLDYLFASAATIWATRNFIVFSATDTFKLIFDGQERATSGQPAKKDALIKRWLDAVAVLQADKRLFVDTWLWSHMPELEFWKIRNGGTAAPATLVEKIRRAVADADKRSVTPYERHAVISGAASILKDVGDTAGAIVMLQKELKQTDTPWYYQSSLASLALSEKKFADAMTFSEQARLSARTLRNATRVQWIVNDVVLLGKIEPLPETKLAAALEDYYGTVFALPDGFAGRNGSRAKTVAKEIKRLTTEKSSQPLQKVISEWRVKCKDSQSPAACHAHFEAVNHGV